MWCGVTKLHGAPMCTQTGCLPLFFYITFDMTPESMVFAAPDPRYDTKIDQKTPGQCFTSDTIHIRPFIKLEISSCPRFIYPQTSPTLATLSVSRFRP